MPTFGGFQQNAFQQDAFQVEAFDVPTGGAFSENTTPIGNKGVITAAKVAVLATTLVGFVGQPPLPPAVAAISSDIVSAATVINQVNSGVPFVSQVVAGGVSGAQQTDIVFFRTVINQNFGVPQPPAAAVIAGGVSGDSPTDIFFYRTVINQAVSSAPTPPTAAAVVPTFADNQFIRISRRPDTSQAGLASPPVFVVSAFTDNPAPRISSKPDARQATFPFSPPATVTPSTFFSYDSIIVRIGPKPDLGQAAVPSAPTVVVSTFTDSPAARISPKLDLGQTTFPFSPTGAAATPSALSFYENIILKIAPKPDVRQLPFVPPPTALVPGAIGEIPTDIIAQTTIIYQANAAAPTPPQVVVTVAFADNQVAKVSPRPDTRQVSFLFTPTPTPSALTFTDNPIAKIGAKPDFRQTAFLQPGAVATPTFYPWSPSPDARITPKPDSRQVAFFLQPVTAVVTPTTLAFSEAAIAIATAKDLPVPENPAALSQPPIPAPFTDSPLAKVAPRPDSSQPPFLLAPTPVSVAGGISASPTTDITFTRTVINQAVSVAFQPPAPVTTPTTFAFGDNPAAQVIRERVMVPDAPDFQQLLTIPQFTDNPAAKINPKPDVKQVTFPFAPAPVSIPGLVSGAQQTDIVFQRTVINQLVTIAPTAPVIVATPTNFWFGAQVEIRIKSTPDRGYYGFLFTPVATPTFYPWSPSPDARIKPTPDRAQPSIAPVFTVDVPSTWPWSPSPDARIKPKPDFSQFPFFLQAVTTVPTPTSFPWSPSPELTIKPKPDRGFYGFYFTPGQTPPFFSWSPSPELYKKPTPFQQDPIAPILTVAVPATWPWSPSPELFKKPTPFQQDPIAPIVTVAVPATWPWSPSPDAIIRPKPDRGYYAVAPNDPFQVSAVWPWSPSPDAIIKPKPDRNFYGFHLSTPPVVAPTFFPWSPSPERIIKPRPLLTPDIANAWTFQNPVVAGQIAVSYEPSVFRQVIVVYQSVAFAMRPVIATPTFWPWSAPPEALIKPLKASLMPPTPWFMPAPPEVIPPSPPGGGKRRFRRPDGARILHPRGVQPQYRDQVIYRRDDYGLPYKVGLFETIEDLLPPASAADAAPPAEAPAAQPQAPAYPQIPAGPAPQNLMGQLAPRGVFSNDQQDVEDAIAALEALQQLGDPMFNLIIDHMIKLLAKK